MVWTVVKNKKNNFLNQPKTYIQFQNDHGALIGAVFDEKLHYDFIMLSYSPFESLQLVMVLMVVQYIMANKLQFFSQRRCAFAVLLP